MIKPYDLVVIGGGSAGLTAAAFHGELGRKVALIERERIGGDCTWTGCVPSKALLKVAKVAHSIRTAEHYGIHVEAPKVNMAVVRQRVQDAIQEVYQHETPNEVAKRGVEVVLGEATFLDAHTIEVNGQPIQSKKFIIATGGRAAIPPIPGLDSVPFKTNHDIFNQEQLPEHLIIIGAGPIGMEMGQAHARLGAKVTIIGAEIMPRDEPEVVETLKHVFETEGIDIMQASVSSIQGHDNDIIVTLDNGNDVRGDMLLIAVGRVPNVEKLNLEKAGVTYTRQGIAVNPYLQTNIPHIYAIGDVTTGPKFTHYAGFQGAIAGRNALLPFAKANGHSSTLPWVTFTDPEIAHVGMTESEARQRYGDAIKVLMMSTAEGDRTVVEQDMDGFIKLVYRGRGDLLGATVVADRAGEMLLEYQLIIQNQIPLRKMVGTIHAYPTYSDVAKKALSKLMIQELLNSRFGRVFKKVAKYLP